MLTATGRTLARASVVTVGAGILFGNLPVIGAGAVLLAFASFSGLPPLPEVRRRIAPERIKRGGRFVVEVDVSLSRGVGIVEVHQQLPEEFELTDGDNVHAFTLGLRARVERFSFRVRAPKRGAYVLPPVDVRALHPLGLSQTAVAVAGEPVELHVEPRALPVRVPRGLRTRAYRRMPEEDAARVGTPGNDFRELREYAPGDPPRRINWKATARRMGSGASDLPLVNETEHEGRKSVWLVVDGHGRMSAGTNLQDAREHAADVALSLAEAFLSRGHRVGLRLARSGPVEALQPAAGQSQLQRLRQTLARLGAGDAPSLCEALDADRAHLHREKPLVVLVTRTGLDDEDLVAALARLTPGRRAVGLLRGVLVDIGVPPTQDDAPAARAAQAVLDAERARVHAVARAHGVRVLSWRPEREPLAAVLLRGRLM